jgi:hypothetical protein
MKLRKVMDVTAKYSGFGSDVTITAPDPSDVESLPSSAFTG